MVGHLSTAWSVLEALRFSFVFTYVVKQHGRDHCENPLKGTSQYWLSTFTWNLARALGIFVNSWNLLPRTDPHILMVWALSLVTYFNICETEEGRLNVTRPFQMATLVGHLSVGVSECFGCKVSPEDKDYLKMISEARHPSKSRQGHPIGFERQEGCGWPVLDQTADTRQTKLLYIVVNCCKLLRICNKFWYMFVFFFFLQMFLKVFQCL